MYVYLPEGEYQVSVERSFKDEKFTFKNGHTYYLQVHAKYEEDFVSYIHYFEIEQMDAIVASEEIKEARFVSRDFGSEN